MYYSSSLTKAARVPWVIRLSLQVGKLAIQLQGARQRSHRVARVLGVGRRTESVSVTVHSQLGSSRALNHSKSRPLNSICFSHLFLPYVSIN